MAGGILRIGDFPVGPICRMDASCPATHYHCEDVRHMVELWQAAWMDTQPLQRTGGSSQAGIRPDPEGQGEPVSSPVLPPLTGGGMAELKPPLSAADHMAALEIYIRKLEATSCLYHELLYGVSMKFPDESRHETALRYIRQAEVSSGRCEAAQCNPSLT